MTPQTSLPGQGYAHYLFCLPLWLSVGTQSEVPSEVPLQSHIPLRWASQVQKSLVEIPLRSVKSLVHGLPLFGGQESWEQRMYHFGILKGMSQSTEKASLRLQV